jgi:hypothetical protein
MPDFKEFERVFKKLAEQRKKEGKDMWVSYHSLNRHASALNILHFS